MGINANGLRFLLLAKRSGVDFSSVAMLGRQGIHIEYDTFLRILNDEFNLNLEVGKVKAIHDEFYADKLFELLGAKEVVSFDYSRFEGATFVHDFNFPISDDFKLKYAVVFDGGMLEHVFFFPTALKSAMEMLKIGGSYFGVSAANNEMGHGFYQLSPELYFRAMSEANGFRVERMFLHGGRETRKWYEIKDPDIVQKRIMLVNTRPTLLIVHSVRVSNCSVFATVPLQSDYSRAWSQDSAVGDEISKLLPARTSRFWFIPKGLKRIVTMSLVWAREKTTRVQILCGGGHDPESMTLFDPVTSAKEVSTSPIRFNHLFQNNDASKI